MLILASNLSPGDDVVTSRTSGVVSRVEILEDGGIHLEFTGGAQEWLQKGQTVVKKDKFSVFFAPADVNPVQ